MLLVRVQISVVEIMESFSEIDLPYDRAVPLWVYTQWRLFPTKETLVHPGSLLLYSYQSKWDQPSSPTKARLMIIWYIYRTEHHSSVEKNGLMKFSDKWKELKKIILSKVAQCQKTIIPCFLLYANIRF